MTTALNRRVSIGILLIATILIWSGVYYLSDNSPLYEYRNIDQCEKSYGYGWIKTDGGFGPNYCTGPTGEIKGYRWERL